MLEQAGGDWSVVEMNVKKTYDKEEMTSVWGKYVTEIDLKGRGWNTEMIANSKAWAQANGCHRKSPIHGEEEWRLPLDEEFKNKELKNEKYEASTSSAVQERNWFQGREWFEPIFETYMSDIDRHIYIYMYIYKYMYIYICIFISVYTSLYVLSDIDN